MAADKRAREAYRVQQFGAPHPATVVQQHHQHQLRLGASVAAADAAPPPDHTRVLVHLDADCFYAQVCVHASVIVVCI